MKMLPHDTEIPWQVRNRTIPAFPFVAHVKQRVISSKGTISPRADEGLGVARQKERLEEEGVAVQSLPGGVEAVDIRVYGWFPDSVQL